MSLKLVDVSQSPKISDMSERLSDMSERLSDMSERPKRSKIEHFFRKNVEIDVSLRDTLKNTTFNTKNTNFGAAGEKFFFSAFFLCRKIGRCFNKKINSIFFFYFVKC